MRRWYIKLLIGLGAFLVLLVGAGLAARAILLRPSAPLAVEVGIEDILEANTAIYRALADLELTDSVVDVSPERVLIRYEVPANSLKEKEALWVYTALKVSEVTPEVPQIIIQTFVGFQPLYQVIFQTKDILEFGAKRLSMEELGKRVALTELR